MNLDYNHSVYVLALIRDGKIRNFEDLTKLQTSIIEERIRNHPHRNDLPKKITPIMADAIAMQIGLVDKYTVKELIDEGFVIETDDGFTVHTLVDKLKPILNISLAELAIKPNEALWVNPVFRTRTTSNLNHDVFVVMPFTNKLLPVFNDHIKNVCSKLNISVARADDFFTTNSIMEDVWAGILSAKVIIADCTDRNPNVFYEIGIAHTLGKRVILLTQNLKDVPFDVRHFRVIVYDFTPRGMIKFEDDLLSTLEREIGSE